LHFIFRPMILVNGAGGLEKVEKRELIEVLKLFVSHVAGTLGRKW